MPTLTVFFDDQYWVGVIEVAGEDTGGRLHRFVFGPEPSGPQILEFVLMELGAILGQPGAPIALDAKPARRVNPKRAAREAARATAEQGISSAAEEAMRLQIEANKQGRRVSARDLREREACARYEQAQARAREKRRGH
jgi:hypothetical protein